MTVEDDFVSGESAFDSIYGKIKSFRNINRSKIFDARWHSRVI